MIKQNRDAIATRKKILDAAKVEFSELGLMGGRIDSIAQRANINKRMLYYYFKDKKNLFSEAVCDSYENFYRTELSQCTQTGDPVADLKRFITFYWQYYLEHPEYLDLINSENLHKGKSISKHPILIKLHGQSLRLLDDIMRQGIAHGVFNDTVSVEHLHITIKSINYHYLTNRYTISYLSQNDIMAPDALEGRLAFNIKLILRMVAPDTTPQKNPA